MNWLGIDIGGANIKIADGTGFARSHVFSLWKHPERLEQKLRTMIADAPPSDHVAATMTGELADCFESKTDGVAHILTALQQAVDGRHTRVYLTDGKLVTPQVALRKPQLAAASNWHVLARFASRYVATEPGLLIDIGSTTTDFIPIIEGAPRAQGATDTERLLSGELLYTGVQRSPLCAVISEVPYRDATCPAAHELFATMFDAYLILGDLPEESTNMHTADGRPATKKFARTRLARMICADSEVFNHRDAVTLAHAASEAQLRQMKTQLMTVFAALPGVPQTIVCSGKGEFLAQRLLKRLQFEGTVVSLTLELGVIGSTCATAHALAVLARETSQK
ncbi:MAG: hypothetical protein KDA60_08260 [Planctomycetales bacterium]|nr:hypothetical protein [Planctomycetales bacterium]